MTLQERRKLTDQFLLQKVLGTDPCCGNCLNRAAISCSCEILLLGLRKNKVFFILNASQDVIPFQKFNKIIDIDSDSKFYYWCPNFRRR